ncbi:MAG: hypothetical protein NZ899_12815 [Thermoguttaceae bacterium]|nr:hypothetical protein [Thermoguttaceae bacterium]MDW8080097.1 hypothetical protein [Thermoguttaceae bacterium]
MPRSDEDKAFRNLARLFSTAALPWLALLLLAGAHLAVAIARNTWVPRLDDWEMVKSYLKWRQGYWLDLFTPLEVHVLPGTKLVLFSLWELFGVQLTVVGIVNVLLLSVLTTIVLFLLRRELRGDRAELYIFVPLMMLGLSPFQIVTWGTGLGITVFYGLAVLVTVLIYSRRWAESLANWHGVWALLVGIMTLYTTGLVFGLLTGVIFFGHLLASNLRRDRARLISGLIWFAIIVGYAAGAFVLAFPEISWRSLTDKEYFAFSWSTGVTFLQTISSPLYRVGERLWPISALGVACFWIATLWMMVRSFSRGQTDHLWLALIIAVFAFLALATSLGRGWQGGFVPRYGMFIGGLYIAAFLMWMKDPKGKLVGFLLCLAAGAVSLWTQGESFRQLGEYREFEEVMFQHAEQGMPILGLAITNRLGACEDELRGLKNLGRGWWRTLKENPDFATVVVHPSMLVWHHHGQMPDGTVVVLGPETYATFTPPPLVGKIYAVLVEYTHRSARNGITIRLSWLKAGREPPFERLGQWSIAKTFWLPSFRIGSRDQFWIGEEVELLALYPDIVPCEFLVHKIELFVETPNAVPLERR